MVKKIDRNEKYVCNLSAELLEKAKKELNEDPARRADDIEALRQWMLKQRHINGRTGTFDLAEQIKSSQEFLKEKPSVALAPATYPIRNIERAKEKIDKYYTLKTALPEWYANTDISDPVLLDILKAGCIVPLGYDKQGRRIIIGQYGKLDPNKYKLDLIFKVNQMISEYVLMDEQTQICGLISVADMKGMGPAHAAQMTPTAAKKMMTNFQDAMPVRMKGGHYFNTPAIFDVLFPMVKSFMKSKFIQRLYFHGSSLESLHKEIAPECLPTEYGGTAGDLSKFTDETVRAIVELREYFIEEEQYKVDESKRPGKPKTLEDLFGVDGTFRKLTID